MDVADELVAAEGDGTLPEVSLAQVWLRDDGHVALLDFQHPAARHAEHPLGTIAHGPVSLLAAVVRPCDVADARCRGVPAVPADPDRPVAAQHRGGRTAGARATGRPLGHAGPRHTCPSCTANGPVVGAPPGHDGCLPGRRAGDAPHADGGTREHAAVVGYAHHAAARQPAGWIRTCTRRPNATSPNASVRA